MNKKRGFGIFIITFLCVSFLTGVYAQGYGGPSLFGSIDLGRGMSQIIDQIVRFLTPIFQVIIGDYSTSEVFFMKILILLVLFLMLYVIMDKVPTFEGYRGIATVIALTISVIAIRYISENDFTNFILLPYGVMGITLTTIFPFIVFAYFIHATDMPGVGRKLSWIFFAVTFLVLWIYRSPRIGELGNQIYFWTLIVMILMVIFDRKIHAYFKGLDLKDFERAAHDNQVANLQIELRRYITLGGPNPSPEIQREIKRIKRRLKHLGAKYA